MALIDARPAGLDLLFRPGTTLVLNLAWPTGTLVGRSFSSVLGSTSVTVDVSGDLMTVTVSDALTALIPSGTAATWTLRESVQGDDEVVVVGSWGSSLRAADTSVLSGTVADGDLNVGVTVTSLGGATLNAHAADIDLHGGGIQLDLAEVTTNFTSSSTAPVDIPGAVFGLTVPARPYVLEAQVPVLIEENGAFVDLQLRQGSTQLTQARGRAQAAGDFRLLSLACPVPCSVHTPTAGATVTYKLTLVSSSTTSDVTVLTDLIGLKYVTYLRAVTA